MKVDARRRRGEILPANSSVSSGRDEDPPNGVRRRNGRSLEYAQLYLLQC